MVKLYTSRHWIVISIDDDEERFYLSKFDNRVEHHRLKQKIYIKDDKESWGKPLTWEHLLTSKKEDIQFLFNITYKKYINTYIIPALMGA